MFYSKSTNGFYDQSINGSNIPSDAVEITVEQHAALILAQSIGSSISADGDGKPIILAPSNPSITDLKIAKNAQINQARAEANASTFTHQGKTFACDTLSRSDIDAINGRIATRDSFPAGWVGGWKAVDNTILAIDTVAKWNDFYDSMVNQGTANFAHAQELKLALAKATTKAQIAAIVW